MTSAPGARPLNATLHALHTPCRLVQTQQDLQSVQRAYGLLATEHQQLQQLRRHEEREGYEVSELYRRQIVDKNKQLEALKQDLTRIKESLAQNASIAAQREEQMQRDFATERQQLGAAAAALQQQLDGRAGNLKEKEELEAEMYRLRKSNVTLSEELGGKVSSRLASHRPPLRISIQSFQDLTRHFCAGSQAAASPDRARIRG